MSELITLEPGLAEASEFIRVAVEAGQKVVMPLVITTLAQHESREDMVCLLDRQATMVNDVRWALPSMVMKPEFWDRSTFDPRPFAVSFFHKLFGNDEHHAEVLTEDITPVGLVVRMNPNVENKRGKIHLPLAVETVDVGHHSRKLARSRDWPVEAGYTAWFDFEQARRTLTHQAQRTEERKALRDLAIYNKYYRDFTYEEQ